MQVDEDAIYRPFCTLSPGEAAKCLLCALFLKENNYLLIDEPTNHLDAAARQAVSRYLRGKKGFLLVSHDRAFLDGCTDHILSINKTDITVQKGNFSTWLENKDRQDAFELAGNQKLKKEIARLNEAAARTASWSDKVEKSKKGTKNSGLRPDRGYIGHKSAKMMKRAMVTKDRMEDAAAQKASLLKNVEEAEDLAVSPLTHHSSRLLEGRDLVISYGGRPVFSPQTFALTGGQRIAVCGKNGCGKSSLLKLAAGAPLSVSGSLFRASGLIVSYVPQDASFLSGSLKAFIRENSLPEPLFLAILRKLDFSRDMFLKDMSGYSAGQKKKVLLAQSLCTKAHLYIWDEPLNYIDIYSRMQLEALILKHGPTMLFVEHDQAFADHVATGKILL